MSSLRRIAASRANGALSRGPKSPETLRVSAGNSLRHGLTARTVLLTNESPQLFQESLNAYLLRLQPRDQVEADLVEEIVVAKWRQRRLWGIETASLNLEMAPPGPRSQHPLHPRRGAHPPSRRFQNPGRWISKPPPPESLRNPPHSNLRARPPQPPVPAHDARGTKRT